MTVKIGEHAFSHCKDVRTEMFSNTRLLYPIVYYLDHLDVCVNRPYITSAKHSKSTIITYQWMHYDGFVDTGWTLQISW